MKKLSRSFGFTLIELLVVIAIVAVLVALTFSATQSVFRKGSETASLSNMRQVGIAFLLHAGEHGYELPGRPKGPDTDKWPKVLAQYLKDVRVYAAPGDPENYLKRNVDPLDNTANNTSFIMNGYNDLGTIDDPSVDVRINRFEATSNILLLGTPKTGSRHYFMDFLEPPHGNNKDVLNLTAYGDGSNYLFADGAAKFIKAKDYDDRMWLVNKSFEIPKL